MHRHTVAAFAVVASCMTGLVPSLLLAHDDGRFANSPLKAWFDQLASGKGLCCSFADGVSIADVDWDTATVADAVGASHVVYRVRLNGQWILVPDAAVVTAPNRFGPAVVWPYQDMNGVTQIRCFIPGAGA
jgi:hypothetical protein